MRTYSPDEAPGFAKASSTFTRDNRCEDVWYVVGEDYDEVYIMTKTLFTEIDAVDYDVNFSTEGNMFVGVVAQDV